MCIGRRQFLFFLLLLTQGLQALACAICAPADGQNTVLYRLHAADTAVLAQLPGQGGAVRVLAQIKGPPPLAPIDKIQGLVPAPATGSQEPVLLLYNAAGQSWRAVGTLGLQRVAWLQHLAAMRPVGVAPVTDWPARLSVFVDDLEDPEPLVAQAAYEEVSVAPYSAMRSVRGRLVATRIQRWLDAPALAARRPLYTLLAGFAGGTDAAGDLRARMQRATQDGSAASLSAALAAYVEVLGTPGVAWIEEAYLARPDRTELEVQAAVMALGVHGTDGARVTRERVVAAYARLAAGNPAMAGFAASDLAGWGHWDMGPVYAEILGSGRPLAFAARYAMVFYLLRSPRPDARTAIEALRAAKAL